MQEGGKESGQLANTIAWLLLVIYLSFVLREKGAGGRRMERSIG